MNLRFFSFMIVIFLSAGLWASRPESFYKAIKDNKFDKAKAK